MSAQPAEQPAPLLKLDLGCGTRKQFGFTGVDARAFDGVDQVVDLTARESLPNSADPLRPHQSFKPWPWADASVEEVYCSHFLEHLTAPERIHFVNELHRVLVPGGKCLLTVPHWASARAYGDLTHQWPPVSEWWFYYLNKDWRAINAPHNDGYTCDFDATWGYALHPSLLSRAQEHQMFALQNYKEAAQDLIATLIKK